MIRLGLMAVAVAMSIAGSLAHAKMAMQTDLAEVTAGERGKEHLTIRSGGDAVRAGASRGI